jgi:hypothetical protein
VELDTAPPAGSVVVCRDAMGPEGAQSFPGRQPVHLRPPDQPAVRARQAIDYGRRGKGYVFGAFQPASASGAAFTACYAGRTTANGVDFLAHVESGLPAETEQVYAILANLSTHRATDVLLFSLAHPRCAGSASLSPSTRRTGTGLSRGGRRCAPWRSRASAWRVGARSSRPSPVPPCTGMPIAIPTSGVAGAAIVPPAALASPALQRSHELTGCTT